MKRASQVPGPPRTKAEESAALHRRHAKVLELLSDRQADRVMKAVERIQKASPGWGA